MPSKERNFFLSLTQQETGRGRGRTAQRGRSFVIPHVLVHMRMDMAPLSGRTLDSGAGQLLAGVWRAIAPLMLPWCAEEEVPTAANLNLYWGWKSCVGWHCDDEPLFGKCGDAKLTVRVTLAWLIAFFLSGIGLRHGRCVHTWSFGCAVRGSGAPKIDVAAIQQVTIKGLVGVCLSKGRCCLATRWRTSRRKTLHTSEVDSVCHSKLGALQEAPCRQQFNVRGRENWDFQGWCPVLTKGSFVRFLSSLVTQLIPHFARTRSSLGGLPQTGTNPRTGERYTQCTVLGCRELRLRR